jgi:hypothetical protein
MVGINGNGVSRAGSDRVAKTCLALLAPFVAVPLQIRLDHCNKTTEPFTIMNKLAAIYLASSLLGVAAPYRECVGAQDVIAKLQLKPNPEKGYYRQTFEDTGNINNRSYSTAIYYLLEGQAGPSYWHRVTDSVEIWHYYAGAPMKLELSWNNGTATQEQLLGSDIFRNQTPQVTIEKGQWQRATSLGDWTLVGTTVAPGFSENGYELPGPNFKPDDGQYF